MINSNFGFTPLQELWLGATYPENFYDHLPNEIADPFRKITEITNEDTGRLQKFLEGRGITVRRPVFDSIDNHLDANDNLAKPPVTPRDHYLVLDKTLFSLHNKLPIDPWHHWMDHYQQHGGDVQTPVNSPINCLSPPSLVRVGRDLFLDTVTHKNSWGFICEWMVSAGQKYRVHICDTGGHSDAVFCPVAPGLIVSSHYKLDYQTSWPDWEVYHTPNTLNNFYFSVKHPSWFTDISAVNLNHAFGQHIIDKANDWIGNAQETVYEVNMLVLDEHNVVAMKEYPPLFEWLDKRGINVHLFDLRTRGFWDGGWHCFTLDIRRDDTCSDIFPGRGNNGVYWNLD
jgi:hypothetical protein